MNTKISKKISETIKMNVVQVPHPTLVGIGISLGVTAGIAAGIAVLADPSHMAHAMLTNSRPYCGGPIMLSGRNANPHVHVWDPK